MMPSVIQICCYFKIPVRFKGDKKIHIHMEKNPSKVLLHAWMRYYGRSMTKMVFVMPNVWSLDNRYLPQLLAGLPEPEKMVKPNLFLPFMLCDEPSPKLFSITCHSAESEQAVKWGYFTHPTDLARAQYHHLEEDACADTHTDTDHTHIHLTVCFLSVPPNSSFDPEGENSEV